jgi:hypothetical protein
VHPSAELWPGQILSRKRCASVGETLAASEGMEPNWAAWQQAASSKMVAVALATNLWYWGVRTFRAVFASFRTQLG